MDNILVEQIITQEICKVNLLNEIIQNIKKKIYENIPKHKTIENCKFTKTHKYCFKNQSKKKSKREKRNARRLLQRLEVFAPILHCSLTLPTCVSTFEVPA